MNPLLSAAFAAIIFTFLHGFGARADDSCTSELREIKNGCAASIKYLEAAREVYKDAASALGDRKNRVAIENARQTLKGGVKELERDGGADSPVGAARDCTKKVNDCLNTCAKKSLCESKGEDKERLNEISRLKKLDEELGKTEGDGTAGGKGDGKGDKDQAKKDDKGGGGGGMPEMPKPPEDKDKENADRSCGGSTPDPSCPPKDDVCFKDPNSVACLCQAGLGTADVCKRAQGATERNQGGGDEGGVGASGGKSATYLNESSNPEMSNGRARANSYSGGGGGGARGGGGLKSLSGGAGGYTPIEPLQPRNYDFSGGASAGGGGSGGYRGASSGSGKEKNKKNYDRMVARGMAIAQRRLAGVGGEIGASHGNLFENVSRAYRAKASTLKK